jgi:MoaA/NifB/PqqE/SkfB family radical SAM enzyme
VENTDFSPEVMMVPEFHPIVSLGLTMGCNQRCLYCGVECTPDGWKKDRMTLEDWKHTLAVLQERVRTKDVHILGGEPFTCSFCMDLVRWCRKRHFKVHVFTNGTLVSREDLQELAKLKVGLGVAIQAGREDVADRIACLPGSHRATLRTIRKALELGVNLFAVSMRTIRESAETQDEARRTLIDMGVSEACLNFQAAQAYGRAAKLKAFDPTITDRWDEGCPTCKGGRLYIAATGDVNVCFVWPHSAGNLKANGTILDADSIMAILRSVEFATRLEDMRKTASSERLLPAGAANG